MESAESGNISILRLVLVLTGSFFVVEVFAGFWNNSLALLSDAGHMLSDILALSISLYAAHLSRRAPTAVMSYGYHRTEVLAGLFNGGMLWLVIGFIGFAAFHRFFEPSPVNGQGVVFVGAAGLLINLVCAWMLHRHEDLNLRGAYYHVLTDALGSFGALLAGVLITWTGWYPFDPLLSLMIGGLVLYSSWSLIRDAVNILMESVPRHLDASRIRQSVLVCDGVENIHDLHIWSIGSSSHALSAHIVVPPQSDASEIRGRVEEILRNEFDLKHTTLQIEVRTGCEDSHD